MRKQVEQLNGCMILTGQETPGTGSALAASLLSDVELSVVVRACDQRCMGFPGFRVRRH